MRVVVDPALGVGNLHKAQHLDGPRERGAAAQAFVQADDLGDLGPHGVDRIERGHRLLEDDGDLLAADLAHLIRPERHQVAALPENLAVDDTSRRHGDELEHGERGDGLAAAGLADHTERLAPVDRMIDAIDRPHHAIVGGEVGLEPANFEQALAHAAGSVEVCLLDRGDMKRYITFRGSSASRNPSPMKLIVRTARKIAAPGKSAQCGAISR